MTKPNPMTTTPAYVALGRVSRVGGRSGPSYGTKEEQHRIAAGVAALNGVTLLPGMLMDENVSGAILDRPGLNEALRMVDEGEAGGIILAYADRLGRAELDEMFPILRRVEAAGGRILTSEGPMSLNGNDEISTVIRMMLAAQNRRRYRQVNADNVRRSVVENGAHLQAVFGYRRADDSKRLVPLEPEAETVREAYRRRAAGESWASIARALNERGVLPRPKRLRRDEEPRQRQWSAMTVRQLIHKRVYLGEAYNGDHSTPNAHPALVDLKTWERATRSAGAKRSNATGGHLLTGLVRCSGCGYVMQPSTSNGRRYYRCQKDAHAGGRCPAPVNVAADELEDVATAWWFERMAELADVIAGESSVEEAADVVRHAERRLTAAVGLLAEARASGASAGEVRAYEAAVGNARAEVTDAERDRDSARRAAAASYLPANPRSEWDEADTAGRRHLLSSSAAAFVLRRGRRWREPVLNRVDVILRDDAPATPDALIALARGSVSDSAAA
jgi:DNA invertase Pin-like site-specific DNA recombinase